MAFDFQFGLDRAEVASELEVLAAKIRSEAVLPQEFVKSSKRTHEDFVLQTITVTFAEREAKS